MTEDISGGSIQLTGEGTNVRLDAVADFRSAGRHLRIRPKASGFIYGDLIDIALNDRMTEDMARAMLAGLRREGYEARLFATSAHTVEIDPRDE